ncbi:hypothetical protein [Kroppenstedtia sanguinis]|uniref:Uncharacterized protein n=1 Tax=Kroppenstedtia sanguinis TaxID=1380684 RepID=A0ABW4CCK2_9BACL
MEPMIQHPWNLDVREAFLLQKELASRVIQENSLKKIERVTSVDVAYSSASKPLGVEKTVCGEEHRNLDPREGTSPPWWTTMR